MLSSITTIRPPNLESCAWTGDGSDGSYSVGSRHQGGAHVLMSDGAIRFVSDNIEAGNQRAASPNTGTPITTDPGSESPYGVWGALGTRSASENKTL